MDDEKAVVQQKKHGGGNPKGQNGRLGYSSIAQHPDRKKIDKEIIRQTPYAEICRKFPGVTQAMLRKYVSGRLAAELVEKQLEQRDVSAEWYLKEITYLSERCHKLLDACDEYLTDPVNPGKYNLMPRADEIEVAYTEVIGTDDRGNDIEKKDRRSLQELIDWVTGYKDLTPYKVSWKTADPRNLILEATRTINILLETMARITGQMQDVVVSVDVRGVVIPTIVQIITRATADNIPLRQDILTQLQEVVQNGL